MRLAAMLLTLFPLSIFAADFLSLKGIVMPNQNFEADGHSVTLMQQTLDLEIGGIEVDTQTAQVATTLELKDIRYHIGVMRVHRKRPTDCYNTTVFIANGDSLPLYFSLPVLVEKGKLALGKISTALEIPPGEYASQGPAYCVGGLFPGIVRKLVARAIANSRETVEQKIEEAIQQIGVKP